MIRHLAILTEVCRYSSCSSHGFYTFEFNDRTYTIAGSTQAVATNAAIARLRTILTDRFRSHSNVSNTQSKSFASRIVPMSAAPGVTWRSERGLEGLIVLAWWMSLAKRHGKRNMTCGAENRQFPIARLRCVYVIEGFGQVLLVAMPMADSVWVRWPLYGGIQTETKM